MILNKKIDVNDIEYKIEKYVSSEAFPEKS